MKALKKIAIYSKKTQKDQGKHNGNDKKKLTNEEKEKLYEIFMGKREPRSANIAKGQNSNILRAKSPLKFEKINISRTKSPGRFEKIIEEDRFY